MSTQRQVKHPPQDLPTCSGCSRAPHHFHDARAPRVGGGDFLECSRCDRRTDRCASFELAIADWLARYRGKPPAANPLGLLAADRRFLHRSREARP